MHELTATQNILSMALTEAARIGASRITRISLKAGEWSSFEPECIEFYFGVLAQGTPAEGAELAVETVSLTYACEDCGLEYAPVAGGSFCPHCSSVKGKLIGGRELYVDCIEVQHEDSRGSESSGGQ